MRLRSLRLTAPEVRAILEGRQTQLRRPLQPQPPCEAECRAAYTSYKLVPAVVRTIKAYSLNDYDRLPKEPGMVDVEGAVGFVRDRCGQTEWRCPLGVPGDRLWVRETWYCDHFLVGDFAGTRSLFQRPTLSAEDCIREWRGKDNDMLYYRADGEAHEQFETLEGGPFRWRPSTNMPRWASRLTLEITDVRAERLQAPTDGSLWVWVVEFRRVDDKEDR